MSDQPEALRLADAIRSDPTYERVHKAAAELRRLHAENERLHQINQAHEMKLSVRGYELQIADLQSGNASLRTERDVYKTALEVVYDWKAHPRPMKGTKGYVGAIAFYRGIVGAALYAWRSKV